MLNYALQPVSTPLCGAVAVARTARGVAWLALGRDGGELRAGLDRTLERLSHRLDGMEPASVDDDEALRETVDAVRAYLCAHDADEAAGAGARLASIEVDLALGTPFQRRVWDALRTIPFGETRTYGRIAEDIGMTKAASRAVGAACGANPIALVVPCHRAVGSNGALVGFAWGGVETKRRLLEIEAVDAGLWASTLPVRR